MDLSKAEREFINRMKEFEIMYRNEQCTKKEKIRFINHHGYPLIKTDEDDYNEDKEIQENIELVKEEYGLEFSFIPKNLSPCDMGHFRYLLSTGKPADSFRFYCDPVFDIIKIEYVYRTCDKITIIPCTEDPIINAVWEELKETDYVEYALSEYWRNKLT